MNVLAPNAALAPEDQPLLVPPRNYIACHQANGFDVVISLDAIAVVYTNAEGHAGVETVSGNLWILNESMGDVLAMINAAQPMQSAAPTPAPRIGERKQDREPDPQNKPKRENHAWPPPPDDMRDGDLPKDPDHDPKNDTWERDRSDANAAKSEN